MHIMGENMIVEVLDGERACKAGEMGELVITELNNRAMPLIRYRIGDMASLSGTPCTCGRSLPVIENIFGRAYDMIKNRNGKIFHGEFFMYIIEDAKRKNLGIGAFQLIQQEQELFKIKIKPEPGYGEETREFITRRIKEGFSADATVVFEEVTKIERASSGKMRLIIGLPEPSQEAG
jgi:phenylacetate-CoA ligase